ncbi:hypothetical protein [Pseudomonas ovata]|uniref:hypothetical protein n=1 Tax=Pseudomonas ovata TaxID=1839709 RepID=UPI001F4E404C|nr:hypothetical protein [Pseudomonas ovata]
MYRQSLFVLLLSLFIAGCYAGPGYYESDVYSRPDTEVRRYYDTGYSPTYYQERRIYVAPQPRYYNPPPRVYYRAPPSPRYYAPGRPPGHGWDNRWRGGDRDRYDRRDDRRHDRGDRGDYRRGDRDQRSGHWDRR